MSLSYRVSLSIQEVVSADDKSVHKIDLRDILSPAQMRELLRTALQERGFEQEDEGAQVLVRREQGGETTRMDLESMELTTELEAEKEVSGNVDAWGDAHTRSAAQRAAEASAQRQANALLERGQQQLQQRVSDQLAQGEEARVKEMNQALQEVYSQALKAKARQLGEVVEQYEGTNKEGEYELVIKVEL